MPEIPTHYYDDKLMIMAMSDSPNRPQPAMTFEQTGKAIQQLAALTAYAPQVLYIWGWQYRGKDTGYPAVAEVNQRLGGYDGLKKLMADARQFNANVSLSDNYDDAYKSSPAWDDNMIARRRMASCGSAAHGRASVPTSWVSQNTWRGRGRPHSLFVRSLRAARYLPDRRAV